jgi:serine/threonine protein phosphatase 1
VLGNAIGCGPESTEILLDIMKRPNVVPVLGCNEASLFRFGDETLVYIIEEDREAYVADFYSWLSSGGESILDCFKKLPEYKRFQIDEYFLAFSLYEIVEVNGKLFFLTHDGIPENISLEALKRVLGTDNYDFLWVMLIAASNTLTKPVSCGRI